MTLLSFKVESEYTFVDFIRGGYVVVSPLLYCKNEEKHPDIRKGDERRGEERRGGERRGEEPFVTMIIILTRKASVATKLLTRIFLSEESFQSSLKVERESFYCTWTDTWFLRRGSDG